MHHLIWSISDDILIQIFGENNCNRFLRFSAVYMIWYSSFGQENQKQVIFDKIYIYIYDDHLQKATALDGIQLIYSEHVGQYT